MLFYVGRVITHDTVKKKLSIFVMALHRNMLLNSSHTRSLHGSILLTTNEFFNQILWKILISLTWEDIDKIMSQFCVCNDSRAVVVCLQLCPDWIIQIRTSETNSQWFRLQSGCQIFALLNYLFPLFCRSLFHPQVTPLIGARLSNNQFLWTSITTLL